MGRISLGLGALLLAATAILHAGGLQMVDRWAEGLPPFQAAALRFVWISDSIDWGVAALIWAVAAWRQGAAWLAAAAIAGLIPLAGAIGVMSIDPTFFGGQMLLGSVLLAAAGLALMFRNASPPRPNSP